MRAEWLCGADNSGCVVGLMWVHAMDVMDGLLEWFETHEQICLCMCVCSRNPSDRNNYQLYGPLFRYDCSAIF